PPVLPLLRQTIQTRRAPAKRPVVADLSDDSRNLCHLRRAKCQGLRGGAGVVPRSPAALRHPSTRMNDEASASGMGAKARVSRLTRTHSVSALAKRDSSLRRTMRYLRTDENRFMLATQVRTTIASPA